MVVRPLSYLLLLALVAGSLGLGSCRRSPGVAARLDAGVATGAVKDGVCYQQSDGCVSCVARGRQPPTMLEAEQSRPTICHPQEPDNCVEFCTVLAPDCALPWVTSVPPCVFDSEAAFARAIFEREAADRPELTFSGRVVDEAGHRVEGALVRVFVSWRSRRTQLTDEHSGKDGGFRVKLRSGPWKYVLRISHPGLASEIVDRLTPDKAERPGVAPAPRVFRLVPEVFVRGKVTDAASGIPVTGAIVQALRSSDDVVEAADTHTADDGTFSLGGLEPRRYLLRVSKFGWRPVTLKNIAAGPSARQPVKLERATVIKGVVRDADGDPAANVIVAAVLSGGPGPTILVTWTTDSEGRFAWELGAGTYYLWARRRDMMVYPPEKIELGRGHEAEVSLSLNHKAGRVSGQVRAADSHHLSADARVVLLNRSSLAFPRPAVGEIGRDGSFLIAGVLPGRYDISVRDGVRALDVVQGPHDVEVPIDPGSTVALRDPVVVRRPTRGE